MEVFFGKNGQLLCFLNPEDLKRLITPKNSDEKLLGLTFFSRVSGKEIHTKDF